MVDFWCRFFTVYAELFTVYKGHKRWKTKLSLLMIFFTVSFSRFTPSRLPRGNFKTVPWNRRPPPKGSIEPSGRFYRTPKKVLGNPKRFFPPPPPPKGPWPVARLKFSFSLDNFNHEGRSWVFKINQETPVWSQRCCSQFLCHLTPPLPKTMKWWISSWISIKRPSKQNCEHSAKIANKLSENCEQTELWTNGCFW